MLNAIAIALAGGGHYNFSAEEYDFFHDSAGGIASEFQIKVNFSAHQETELPAVQGVGAAFPVHGVLFHGRRNEDRGGGPGSRKVVSPCRANLLPQPPRCCPPGAHEVTKGGTLGSVLATSENSQGSPSAKNHAAFRDFLRFSSSGEVGFESRLRPEAARARQHSADRRHVRQVAPAREQGGRRCPRRPCFRGKCSKAVAEGGSMDEGPSLPEPQVADFPRRAGKLARGFEPRTC